MSIGPAVRRRLGRFEAPMARAYRALAVDIGRVGDVVAAVPPGTRMLEVGTGDGLVARAVLDRCPDTNLLGIDLIDAPGRMVGDDPRASFRTIDVAALLAEGGAPFDSVLLADVLHHVPAGARRDLLECCGSLLAGGGALVIKETVRTCSPGYPWSVFSDRFVTGDRDVSCLSVDELDRLVALAVPGFRPVMRRTVRPWSANVVTAYRRSGD